MNFKTKELTTNQFLPQLYLGIIFSITLIVIPANYNLILPIILFGSLFIYRFSPTIAFIYSFIFVIDPMASFKLSALSIIPILLCFTYIFLNAKKCLAILTRDKYLKKIMSVCLMFSIYQVIISILLLSQQDVYYLFKNIRYWLGVWLLIPAYIFIVLDRKTLLLSITLISLIIVIFYYLSFFGIYQLFELREFRRNEDNDELMRFFSFDLRQITKFFVYLTPLFLVFPIKNPFLKITIPLIGILVYTSVLLALLRTEMFYLFWGATLSFFITFRQIKANSAIRVTILGAAFMSLILFWFPSLFDSVTESIKLTLNSTGGVVDDETLSHRRDVQLPFLIKIIETSPFFGGGLYSVSAAATSHHLFYDIPVLGAFGAYGIIGMVIYYSRFIYIFKAYKLVKITQKLFNQFPIECLVTNGLLAYFVTMISFRTLHINLELAFDFGMAEFGLFIGVYFGIIKLLSEHKAINAE